MKKQNINASSENDETEDRDLLLNDSQAALRIEYIIPIICKMMYTIQNSTLVTIIVLNFNHHHSLIKVSKIHDEFEYLNFFNNILTLM